MAGKPFKAYNFSEMLRKNINFPEEFEEVTAAFSKDYSRDDLQKQAPHLLKLAKLYNLKALYGDYDRELNNNWANYVRVSLFVQQHTFPMYKWSLWHTYSLVSLGES